MKFKQLQFARLDGAQGEGEQRTETYNQYGEGVAEPATQRSAKSTSSSDMVQPVGRLVRRGDYSGR